MENSTAHTSEKLTKKSYAKKICLNQFGSFLKTKNIWGKVKTKS